MSFLHLSLLLAEDVEHTPNLGDSMWEKESYLGDEVVLEFNVTVHCVKQIGWDEVSLSLELMQDSLCIRHALFLYARTAVSANCIINHFRDFI